jgi:hypothetical protein
LKIDEICNLWLEARKYLENFKTIFNSNSIKFNEIVDFLKKNIDFNENSMYTAMSIFKEKVITEDIQKYEALLTSELSEFILSFLRNEKVYKIKNRTLTMQSIIFEYFDAAIEKMQNLANQNNMMGFV